MIKSGLLIFYCLLLFVSEGIAQDLNKDYSPIDSFRIPKKIILDYRAKFAKWGQTTSLGNARAKIAFNQMAIQKPETLSQLDSAGLLMYDDSVTVFLQELADQIIQSNDKFKDHAITVFTLRDIEPNAYNIGEGIIFFSLGLLERLETVDQIAFILAHEISHDVLAHVYNDGERFCEHYYDTQFKRTFRQTARQRIGRNTRMQNLVNGFFANQMSYSRVNELAADSLGFILSKNAGFRSTAVFDALDILDGSDKFWFADTLPLHSTFNFEHFKFKPYWMNTSNSAISSLIEKSLIESPDSLKSHPDCEDRIELIKRRYYNEVIDNGIQDSLALGNFNDVISFEIIGALLQNEDYVMVLHQALHLRQKYPENIYLKCAVAHSLYELSVAMKANKFLQYVAFPNNEFTAGYNHLLSFLHNMTSTSLIRLFDAIMIEWLGDLPSHSYVAFLKILRNHAVELNEEALAQFELDYHNAYLTRLLRDRLLITQNE